MEKYGTYRVYRNVETGDIKRVKEDEGVLEDLEKSGETYDVDTDSKWEELDYDPEEK